MRATRRLALLLLLASPAAAQEEGSRFKDPLDGKFDMSAHLASAAGFLPIVSPITEPAVDYGGTAVLAFFHRPAGWTLQGAREAFEAGERQAPSSVSLAAGGYTFNHSWLLGAGRLGFWREDHLRYSGFGGYGAFNPTLSGELPDGSPGEAEYSLEGWFILQALQWRLKDSPWLIGLRVCLNGTQVAPSADPVLDLGLPMVEARNGARGVTVGYDTRDNVFTPTRGFDGSVEIRRYDDAFLGDFDYWEGTAELKGCFEAGPGSLGTRTKGMTSGEDVPFWALPAVGMWGSPPGSTWGRGWSRVRWSTGGTWTAVGAWWPSAVRGGPEENSWSGTSPGPWEEVGSGADTGWPVPSGFAVASTSRGDRTGPPST